MFILLISRGTPSKYDPQWGCFEKDQAEALVSLGHKVIVVSVDSRFRLIPRKLGITHAVINGIDYYTSFFIPGALSRKLGGFRFNTFLKLWQLRRIYKYVIRHIGKPDVIYSHYLSNTYLATRLKNEYGIPIVAIEHWSKLNSDQLPGDARLMGDYAYKRIDTLISVSNSLRLRLLQHFDIDSIVVYNMVGSEFCQVGTSIQSLDKIRFVSTGSLIYRKGFDLLILAFNKLKLSLNNWELDIVGEGKLRKKLQTQIEQSNLQNNIYLIGRKDKNEIADILSNSHIFILPSRNENFSVAVLEALCKGVPVIASICGGIKECINDSNGLLFPVEDIDSLAAAIKYMLENCHSYDRQKISEEARMRFAPDVIARKLTAIFETTISKYKENQI